MVPAPGESEERIVRYLFDEMGEEERSRLEEQLFHDPSFFERVHTVEDDLILRFVRGDLDSQLASRFTEVYMNEPTKRARVESARVWRQAAGEIAASSKLKPAFAFWLRFSAAVAAVVAILFILLSPLLRKKPVQQFVQTSEKTSYASFQLEPGLTRSRGGQLEINVSPGTDVVLLELALPDSAGRGETYHVVLGTPEHPAAWNGAASAKGAVAVASVPAKVLKAGDYTLELQVDGKDVGTYSFRVAK